MALDLRPRENRDQGDAENESVLDAKGHEESCYDTTTEYAHPKLYNR